MGIIHNILLIKLYSGLTSLGLIISFQSLFGVSFPFILKFFGKMFLLMAASVIISKLLKLDKVYDDLQHHEDT